MYLCYSKSSGLTLDDVSNALSWNNLMSTYYPKLPIGNVADSIVCLTPTSDAEERPQNDSSNLDGAAQSKKISGGFKFLPNCR